VRANIHDEAGYGRTRFSGKGFDLDVALLQPGIRDALIKRARRQRVGIGGGILLVKRIN
jgi:hypothetical protein